MPSIQGDITWQPVVRFNWQNPQRRWEKDEMTGIDVRLHNFMGAKIDRVEAKEFLSKISLKNKIKLLLSFSNCISFTVQSLLDEHTDITHIQILVDTSIDWRGKKELFYITFTWFNFTISATPVCKTQCNHLPRSIDCKKCAICISLSMVSDCFH